MDTASQNQAKELFEQLVEAHLAAVESMRMISQSEANVELLNVALRSTEKFRPEKISGEFDKRSSHTVERAKKMVADGFSHQRGMLLISLCALMDLTTKEIVAEKITKYKDQFIKKLPAVLKEKLAEATSKTNGANTESLFFFIDKHFKIYPEEKQVSYAQRFRYWLDLVDEEPSINPEHDQTINDGYLVRNWILHRSPQAIKMLQTKKNAFWNAKLQNIRLDNKQITLFKDACHSFIFTMGFKDI